MFCGSFSLMMKTVSICSSRGDVSAMMGVLERSSHFRCATTLAWFKKTTIATLSSMSAVLHRVLERMVRAVVTFRNMSWEEVREATKAMMNRVMQKAKDWWNKDMKLFYNRGVL
jgi:hypothetical protein